MNNKNNETFHDFKREIRQGACPNEWHGMELKFKWHQVRE